MVEFACGGCGRRLRADEERAGRRSRCKSCGAVTIIPGPDLSRSSLPPRAPAPAILERKSRDVPPSCLPRGIERNAWISLGIGAGLAVLALAVPTAQFVLGILVTIIHEFGHVATAWILGSPALPSFDLTHGGGVSHVLDRQPLLIALLYAACAAFLFRERHDRPTLILGLIAVALYTAIAFSPVRDLPITAMGHGAELVFAGIFLYRALSGSQILHGSDRPLYAFLGLYLILADARFAYGLIASREGREAYGEAKGGGQWMDFSQIANEQLHVRLEAVAGLFLVACFLTPVCAFLFHRYGSGWKRWNGQ